MCRTCLVSTDQPAVHCGVSMAHGEARLSGLPEGLRVLTFLCIAIMLPASGISLCNVTRLSPPAGLRQYCLTVVDDMPQHDMEGGALALALGCSRPARWAAS